MRAVLRDAIAADVEIGECDIRGGVALASRGPQPLRGGGRIAPAAVIAQIGERPCEFRSGGPRYERRFRSRGSERRRRR